MAVDRLSEVLDLVAVRSVVSGASAVRGPWRTHGPVDDDLKFVALVHGSATLWTDGVDGALEMVAGDVAVLNGRSWLTLEGGEGDGARVLVEPPVGGTTIDAADVDAPDVDVVLGGRVELDPTGRELLLKALPPLVHVGASSPVGAQVRGHVHRLFSEMVADRAGADFAIRQYGQLLVLDIVRGFMQDADMPPGWLKVLADERLRPALALIHEQPAKTWGLDDLARASAMSRSTFAQRFRDVAGVPPLAYLIRWRMLVAQRELRSGDTRVGALAFVLGYSSESAFSSAFKRSVGMSPLAYRTQARQDA